jgi:heavy metal sensor kinase
MKQIKRLRIRFAIWTTSLVLFVLAAFGAFVYANLSLSLHTAVDNSLSLSASQIAASLNVDNGQIIITEPITPEESGLKAFSERGLTLIVLSKDGAVLESAGPSQNTLPSFDQINPEGSFLTVSSPRDDDFVRVYILPVLDNGQTVGWVQAFQSLKTVRDTLDRLLLALMLGGGFLSILAGFIGYFLAARALAPIDNITRTAENISSEDLSARLTPPDTEDEVSRLATTFNNMLGRLENGFKRERQFTADASHELRTPLAAMQAILSVVREGERPVAEYRQALEDLADETDRMRGLVEDLLSLVRGEGGLTLHLETIDLSVLLSDVVDSLLPLAQAKGVALLAQLPPKLFVRGDMDSMIRLFVNLIDNAIKYTEKGEITIAGVQETGKIRVTVSDTGIGIPPEYLSHIFERFYRVEAARSSAGTGLGLAIARQIAQAHAGEIKVESKPKVGTTFSVILPI